MADTSAVILRNWARAQDQGSGDCGGLRGRRWCGGGDGGVVGEMGEISV